MRLGVAQCIVQHSQTKKTIVHCVVSVTKGTVLSPETTQSVVGLDWYYALHSLRGKMTA